MKKKTEIQKRWSEIVHNDDFMPYISREWNRRGVLVYEKAF